MQRKHQIIKGTPADFQSIQGIVNITWPITYGPILTDTQISYMLDLIYSDEALAQQLMSGHAFYLLKDDQQAAMGFIDLEKQSDGISKLHKIYLLPGYQGQGLGKQLLQFAIRQAQKQGSQRLRLNVNRHNKAVDFYQKMGLQIVDTVDIPIGHGYFMNDYVLELTLAPTGEN